MPTLRNRKNRKRSRKLRKVGGGIIYESQIGIAQGDGYKKPTEDRVSTLITEKYAVLGVFDGHGGYLISDLVSKELMRKINSRLKVLGSLTPENVMTVLTNSFDDIDSLIVTNGRLNRMGSTASVVVILPEHLVVANVGDSPAFIFNKHGDLLDNTSNHDCSNPDELTRIFTDKKVKCTKLPGDTILRLPTGLMVTRSFGDVQHDKDVVIGTPQTYVWERVPGSYLCICSDSFNEGIQDGSIKPIYDNMHIVHELLPTLEKHDYNLQKAANEAVLNRVAAMQNYGDNTSLILVGL